MWVMRPEPFELILFLLPTKYEIWFQSAQQENSVETVDMQTAADDGGP